MNIDKCFNNGNNNDGKTKSNDICCQDNNVHNNEKTNITNDDLYNEENCGDNHKNGNKKG